MGPGPTGSEALPPPRITSPLARSQLAPTARTVAVTTATRKYGSRTCFAPLGALGIDVVGGVSITGLLGGSASSIRASAFDACSWVSDHMVRLPARVS